MKVVDCRGLNLFRTQDRFIKNKMFLNAEVPKGVLNESVVENVIFKGCNFRGADRSLIRTGNRLHFTDCSFLDQQGSISILPSQDGINSIRREHYNRLIHIKGGVSNGQLFIDNSDNSITVIEGFKADVLSISYPNKVYIINSEINDLQFNSPMTPFNLDTCTVSNSNIGVCYLQGNISLDHSPITVDLNNTVFGECVENLEVSGTLLHLTDKLDFLRNVKFCSPLTIKDSDMNGINVTRYTLQLYKESVPLYFKDCKNTEFMKVPNDIPIYRNGKYLFLYNNKVYK